MNQASSIAHILAVFPDCKKEVNVKDVADGFGLSEMTVQRGVMQTKGQASTKEAKELLLRISLAIGQVLDDENAPNYVEMDVQSAGQPKYTLRLQRSEKVTPHQARLNAEAEHDHLRNVIRECADLLRKPDVHGALDLLRKYED